jgi:ADP-L-glycero-D-manno-heptose 6-epimerase
MNITPQIEYIDMPVSIRGQYQYFTEADTTKLLKIMPELKFESLENAIMDYVTNYLMQTNPHC